MPPVDALVAAFVRGEVRPDALPRDLDADQQSVLIRAAMRGRIEEVVDAFGADYRGVADGSPGSSWWRSPGFDYVGVMELLVAAGATLEPRFVDVAHGPLEEWLDERL
jgi:hypothetical protein